jgi:hypothetical protein
VRGFQLVATADLVRVVGHPFANQSVGPLSFWLIHCLQVAFELLGLNEQEDEFHFKASSKTHCSRDHRLPCLPGQDSRLSLLVSVG